MAGRAIETALYSVISSLLEDPESDQEENKKLLSLLLANPTEIANALRVDQSFLHKLFILFPNLLLTEENLARIGLALQSLDKEMRQKVATLEYEYYPSQCCFTKINTIFHLAAQLPNPQVFEKTCDLFRNILTKREIIFLKPNGRGLSVFAQLLNTLSETGDKEELGAYIKGLTCELLAPQKPMEEESDELFKTLYILLEAVIRYYHPEDKTIQFILGQLMQHSAHRFPDQVVIKVEGPLPMSIIDTIMTTPYDDHNNAATTILRSFPPNSRFVFKVLSLGRTDSWKN